MMLMEAEEEQEKKTEKAEEIRKIELFCRWVRNQTKYEVQQKNREVPSESCRRPSSLSLIDNWMHSTRYKKKLEE